MGAMVEELEELWRKLSFTDEEDEGIALGNSSTRAAREWGRLCAILKILSHRSLSELKDDLFLVEFGDESDKKRAMDMSP